eukprot:TRINITY_DN3360_c0_g2_i1.p3 TRINITY_DN3360_c0_g2~~TRINITY_DN3360_c0_g2_i1.p3  ORF type:complete len:170 (+),score=21.39 TRINITY_DN3360_c0_g2_i1:963-1472(+)
MDAERLKGANAEQLAASANEAYRFTPYIDGKLNLLVTASSLTGMIWVTSRGATTAVGYERGKQCKTVSIFDPTRHTSTSHDSDKIECFTLQNGVLLVGTKKGYVMGWAEQSIGLGYPTLSALLTQAKSEKGDELVPSLEVRAIAGRALGLGFIAGQFETIFIHNGKELE